MPEIHNIEAAARNGDRIDAIEGDIDFRIMNPLSP